MTKQQRDQILSDFYQKFSEMYPFYLGPNKKSLPEAIYPSNIQGLASTSANITQLNIPEPQKSILFGTILSDGSIRIPPRYRNARIQNRHSTRQYTWFFWKWLVALESFANGLSSITYQVSDGYQEQTEAREGEVLGKLHINSKALPELTNLHRIICQDGREFIDRSWLNHMSSYFLMCVWLDDGSLYHTYQGCICLDFSTQEELQIFCDYLGEAWGVKAHVASTGYVMTDGRERMRIFVSDQDSLLKLLRLVAPLVPVKEMIYKILFVPRNNPELLQRWASEIKELVQPEFREYVENFYDQKINGR